MEMGTVVPLNSSDDINIVLHGRVYRVHANRPKSANILWDVAGERGYDPWSSPSIWKIMPGYSFAPASLTEREPYFSRSFRGPTSFAVEDGEGVTIYVLKSHLSADTGNWKAHGLLVMRLPGASLE